MLIHHSVDVFLSALKRYMTCHAIYWQKARTESKDIDVSDRLTGGCVCQRVKGLNLVRHPKQHSKPQQQDKTQSYKQFAQFLAYMPATIED
jgi:hypothetical protein